MKQLKEIIQFRDDLFFQGAVQADWFYLSDKAQKVSENFVFHGPKYFGVTSEDVKDTRLIDTASFTDTLVKRVYQWDDHQNPFILAIAGYGTGKSHLAVTLSTLLTNNIEKDLTLNKILRNIESADREISLNIKKLITKPNLVITLNGMKDSNLNYEILKSAKQSLLINNISTDVLKTLTKAYEIARLFIENNFSQQADKFIQLSQNKGLVYPKEDLYEYLYNNIEENEIVFDIINEVYSDITRHNIRWDEDISAGTILTKLSNDLCGDRGHFNKVIVIFDEFGRYLEYASSYPTKAGDSALQQIYEAVQNAEGNLLFLGFIQSDIKTYLQRVDQTTNISRYIGRYDYSEKFHLSSNLETIFANLINKTDHESFKKYVVSNLDKRKNEIEEFHTNLLRWLPQIKERGVWKNWDTFNRVIVEGVYPLHPLSTWLLSSLSDWLQNRSSLTLLNKTIQKIGQHTIKEFGDIPEVFPIEMLEGDLFEELLSAEQEGRQRSQYCIVYDNILKKYKDKLDNTCLNILASNLILRICRFKTESRNDIYKAFSYCCNLSESDIASAINILEVEYGVLSYDEVAHCFDFVEDSTGASDFRNYIKKKKNSTTLSLTLLTDSKVKELAGLLVQEDTNFSQKYFIQSNEWQFDQYIYPISSLRESDIDQFYKEWQYATTVDKTKGKLVWVYINKDTREEELTRIQDILGKSHIKAPIKVLLINDKENRLFSALLDYQVVTSIESNEKIKFSRFISDYASKVEDNIRVVFDELKREKLELTGAGIKPIEGRIKSYLTDIFEEIYPYVIPFNFDGFKNKQTGKFKKILCSISKFILSESIDNQSIKVQTVEFKNRFDSVLSGMSIGSWQLISDDLKIVEPRNSRVSRIYSELDELLNSNKEIYCKEVIRKYLLPPYGLNEYSLSLLLFTYLANRSYTVKLDLGDKRYSITNWSDEVIDDSTINFNLFEKTKIVWFDPGQTTQRFSSLFKRIDSNNDISKVTNLQHELENLLNEEDIPQDIDAQYKLSKMKLDEGKNAYEKYIQKVANLKSKIEDDLEKESFYDMLQIISECSKVTPIISEGSGYQYTASQLEEFVSIEENCRNYIEQNISTWIPRQKCMAIGDITTYEKKMGSLAKLLEKNGYIEYSKQVQTQLDLNISNIDEIKAIQVAKENSKSFVGECNPTKNTPYTTLIDWKSRAESLISNIEKNKLLDKNEKKNLTHEVEVKLQKLNDFIEIIKNDLDNVYKALFDITTNDELTQLFNKVKELCEKGIPLSDKEDLIKIGDSIQNYFNDIETLELYKNDRLKFEELFENLENKYSDDDTEIDLIQVLNDYKIEVIEYMDSMEEIWISKYLAVKVEDYNQSQLLNWINNTKMLPEFLSINTQQKYIEIKVYVENRLKEEKLNFISGLFAELSQSEKNECIQLLQKLL